MFTIRKKTFFHPFIVIFFLWLFAAGMICYDGLNDKLQPSDVGIVYGNEVLASGEPSARLKARLDKSISLYRSGYFKTFFVSGGIGKAGFDEAKVMADYLILHDVPSTQIIIDSQGKNSHLTAINAKHYFSNDTIKIIGISQFYHLTRIRLSLQQVGFTNISTAHADYFEWRDIYSTLREVPALIKYYLWY